VPRPTLEHWTTAITEVQPNSIAYRGVPIQEVIDSWGFPETIWLLIDGRRPTSDQQDALRRALVAACDHGVAAPSTVTARVVASTRGAPGVAVAAGLAAFSGPAHGGAASACAAVLTEFAAAETSPREGVRTRLDSGTRIPGFGHPYHSSDPRVPGLLDAPLPERRFRDLVREIEAAIVEIKGERLRMNADAAVAALLLDAGLRPRAIDLVTSIGRCVGLAAHVNEEEVNEAPFRAPSLTAVDYRPLDLEPEAR
jgi:citrate synthase